MPPPHADHRMGFAWEGRQQNVARGQPWRRRSTQRGIKFLQKKRMEGHDAPDFIRKLSSMYGSMLTDPYLRQVQLESLAGIAVSGAPAR